MELGENHKILQNLQPIHTHTQRTELVYDYQNTAVSQLSSLVCDVSDKWEETE